MGLRLPNQALLCTVFFTPVNGYEFLLFAIQSGLLSQWAEAFPDPRQGPEIGMEVIMASHLAAHFAGLYSMRKSGYVRRSAAVLGALDSSVEVLTPEQGLSGRGTSDDKLMSGDVVRKLLVKLENHVDLQEPLPMPPCAPNSLVKVRKQASRRAVTGAEHMKSGEWQMQKLSSTRSSEIVFSIATVVLRSSLYHLFANKQAGVHVADKTRHALAFEQLRSHRTPIIVYAGSYFEIFETLNFAHFILYLPVAAQGRLRHWLDEQLHLVIQRE